MVLVRRCADFESRRHADICSEEKAESNFGKSTYWVFHGWEELYSIEFSLFSHLRLFTHMIRNHEATNN